MAFLKDLPGSQDIFSKIPPEKLKELGYYDPRDVPAYKVFDNRFNPGEQRPMPSNEEKFSTLWKALKDDYNSQMPHKRSK